MGKTAEEAMLVAAMNDDQAELDRLAQDATVTEARYMIRAMDRVRGALAEARRRSTEMGLS